MLRNWLSLFLAFALLSANLLSIDFDGEAFEGKGIDTAVLHLPAAAQPEERATATQRENDAPNAHYAPAEEGTRVFAFEVAFTLFAKYHVPLPSLVALLPVPFPLAAPTLSEPLLCAATPRGPPPKPIVFRSCFLRAPPAFPLA